MTITDISGVTREAANTQDLELILNRRREDGLNSFWLCNTNEEFPRLSVLVKDHLATLYFLPTENGTSFRSIGALSHLQSGELITFAMSNYRADDVSVPNDAVVPFSLALQAAKEFLGSDSLPRSIQWLEL
jgi:hypothetical protein